MITGTVNADSEAVIRLVVQGPVGHVHEIEAVIDTGFNGFLTLPSALVTMLGLTRLSRGRALLANGSEELFDIQIRESKFTVVLLTPNAVDKPWLMWKAGAVSGVSLATREASTVIPIVYRLSMEQMPSPLRSRQAAFGEDRESIGRVLETLKQSTPLPAAAFTEFVKLFVPRYLENVARALAETPPPLTESAVHDWLDRITYFERTDRRSEVGQLHRAMVNVFASGDNAFETPLDVRLPPSRRHLSLRETVPGSGETVRPRSAVVSSRHLSSR
jgi:predicted aspartyl protease